MSKKPQHAKHAAEKSSFFKFPSNKKGTDQENLTEESAVQAPEQEDSVQPEKKKFNLTSSSAAKTGSIDNMLLVRLVIASVIFAVSLIIKMPVYARTILLAVAAAAAGYDIFLDAAESIQQKNYFATPIVVAFVTLASFIIGFGTEGAALVLLYQIGILLIIYTTDKTRKSAQDLLRYQDGETVQRYHELIKQNSAGHMEIEDTMRYSSGSVLKLAMIFAVIYGIALPLFTSYNYIVSIHRALMIILIATPVSVVAAMPVTGIVGLCYSAQQGVLFKDAESLEKVGLANTVVIDKSGVFTDEAPKIISMQSDLVDKDTFMNFAAHALYYSEQPVAKAIAAINNLEYRLELISDFEDLPGLGVTLKIGGADVCLATNQFFAGRGVEVPKESEELGQTFYMTVSGKYVGKIIVSNDLNSEAAEMCEEFSEVGLNRCILLTEDSEADSQSLAAELDISEVVPNCNIQKKMHFLNDLKGSKNNNILYIYAQSFEAHSAADVDIRISKKAKFADAQVNPGYMTNIPFAVQVSRRMREVAISNAVFAFLVKVVLIFLSIVGYCNIWFAIFIDMAAALATVLNAIRVTNESLIASIKYKSGH